ncbi:hypothetical protein SAMN06269185_2210 [Natronoarchaeum philippinense]|uniref:HTH domain protein n=1 Tax=Natronoarchaeum philippinense TaxID=558529 RepID=A0A285NVF6_NATPI|nr:hypothetical protein [Natronoarchaeum philippinense]SNZ13474.1 hypothetical protein SAMN06269185_2210 [Natronoarchaeum philippinense]
MRTVRDETGKRYVLLKESGDSSLVRDPETGQERYIENDTLDPVDGETPLETAASGIPESVRRVVSGVHDEAGLGLLADLADRGPVAVRDMLGAYDQCESDLHGRLAELRAAGLIEEATVAGERGYDATETTREALNALRE